MEYLEMYTSTKKPDIKIAAQATVDSVKFTMLYENYYKRVYNFVYYRTSGNRNRQITEDLVSQIFERILLHYSSFDEKKGILDVWVFTIARNTLYDHFRRKKAHTMLSLDTLSEGVSDKPSPDSLLLQKEESFYLEQALHTLSDKENLAVSLKYGMHLKNKEIALMIGKKEANVGVILYRALKKMKKEMIKGGFTFNE